MKNRLFNVVPIKRQKSNLFDLSHEKKLSFNMGELIPIYSEDIIPGDKFRLNSELIMRLAPMVAPMMHRVNVFTHFFFVPYRLLWSNWENFITGGPDGTIAPTFPTIQVNNNDKDLFYQGNLSDYLGIPPTNSSMTVVNFQDISALPFRAYQLIYNEYYRDQNLEAPVPITKNDTVLSAEKTQLCAKRMRAWEKDYFTSALPWVQRGADVVIPGTPDYMDPARLYKTGTQNQATNGALTADSDNPSHLQDAGMTDLRIENLDGYDIKVNDLRRAVKLQQWLENNARAGSRYIEQILSHFGVRSSDSRLQRPQYLGGGRTPIVVSEVLNTSATATEPQGSMAGHGIAVGNTHGFKQGFEEHGIVMGIMSVLPRTAYQQGIDKSFFKKDKFDYFWPEFAHLGEQAIQKKELYVAYTGANINDQTFGYTPRYAEYKFKNSSYHGDFRSDLSFWHMGRIFSNPPALNTSFMKSDPTHRVFAVTDPSEHKLWCQVYNNVQAIRPIPVFGEPQL